MGAAPFYTRHDGPYRLQVSRGIRSETLAERQTGVEAETSALALLTDDPAVTLVTVWSDSENQHVMTYRRLADGLAPAPVAARIVPVPLAVVDPPKAKGPKAPPLPPDAAQRKLAADIGAALDTRGMSPAQKAWATRRAMAAAKLNQ
jgi:hypothetical protein